MRWARRMLARAIGGRRAVLEEHYQMNTASASRQLSGERALDAGRTRRAGTQRGLGVRSVKESERRRRAADRGRALQLVMGRRVEREPLF